MSVKDLKDFYGKFFNGHFFRDIDYITGKWTMFKDADPKDKTDRLRYRVKNNTNDYSHQNSKQIKSKLITLAFC